MRGRKYKLEILWSNGVLTETTINETQKELIERFGELFILAKYELEGNPEAKPYSFQVWDVFDNPVFPIEAHPRTKEVIA